jgi:hypothetical protein
MPVDYSQVYPQLNGYIVKPLLVNPPLCTLKELQDGTYTLYDLEMFHQILEIKQHMQPSPQGGG